MKKIYLLTTILFLAFTHINAQDAYLGDIKMTGITFTQRGWLACEGQLLQIAQYNALYSLL